MTNPRFIAGKNAEAGFVLVTSLIFLVVITLLAVSAIRSSTLQERMASNLRDKSRARQAADAALRQGERLLQDPMFGTCRRDGPMINIKNPDNNAQTIAVKLWPKDSMIPTGKKNDPEPFLDPAVWHHALTYQPNSAMPKADFYIEEYDCETDRHLNIYRITARALGKNPAAIAVTQSIYWKRY